MTGILILSDPLLLKESCPVFSMRLESQAKSVVGTSTSLSGRFLLSALPQMADDEESPLLLLNGEVLISQSLGKI